MKGINIKKAKYNRWLYPSIKAAIEYFEKQGKHHSITSIIMEAVEDWLKKHGLEKVGL